MHNLAIISPIWKRPALTRLFLAYYEDAPARHKVCVYSPEDKAARDIVGEYRGTWEFVQAPNNPLGDKHNTALQALRGRDIDAVCLIPSDDFFQMEYFRFVQDALATGHDAIRLTSLYFYCLATHRLINANRLGIGAGFVFSRALLERMDWHAWPAGANASMDANMFAHCKNHFRNMLITDCEGFAGVDVKGRTTRNAFENLWKCWIREPGRAACTGDAFKASSFWVENFPTIADKVLRDRMELSE